MFQFAAPPKSAGIAALSQWAVHRGLRMPHNSMSTELCCLIGFCPAVNPIFLEAYCTSTQSRFAYSNRSFMVGLCAKVSGLVVGVDSMLSGGGGHGIPKGGLGSPPILSPLLSSLELKGPMLAARAVAESTHEHRWLLSAPTVTSTPGSRGLQSAVLDILMRRGASCDPRSRIEKPMWLQVENLLRNRPLLSIGFNTFTMS